MSRKEKQLIKKAIKKHGKIYPINGKTLEECFTTDFFDTSIIIFWYNTKDNSTHIQKG